MTPVIAPPRRTPAPASVELRLAAQIARDAAEALASEASESREVSRYLFTADRLTSVLDNPRASRQRLLMASPAVTESSGRSRTLVEMIEIVDGEILEDVDPFRLAKLLLRALVWRPETFPLPSE